MAKKKKTSARNIGIVHKAPPNTEALRWLVPPILPVGGLGRHRPEEIIVKVITVVGEGKSAGKIGKRQRMASQITPDQTLPIILPLHAAFNRFAMSLLRHNRNVIAARLRIVLAWNSKKCRTGWQHMYS